MRAAAQTRGSAMLKSPGLRLLESQPGLGFVFQSCQCVGLAGQSEAGARAWFVAASFFSFGSGAAWC